MRLKQEWGVLLALLVLTGSVLYAWLISPERVPVHWGPDGTVDRYGGKWEAFGVLPLVMLGAVALMYALQQGRGRANAGVLRTVRVGLLLLASLITLASALGWGSARPVVVGTGLFLALIGNVIAKAQPSAWVGFRTPWTFLSRRAWYASQRRGAAWLTWYGVALALLSLLLPDRWLFPWLLPVGLMTSLLLMVGWLVYASYLDYKHDPDPEPVKL